MKPWEGKHWKEKILHAKLMNEKFDTGQCRSDPWSSIYQYMLGVESGLKKDWEDEIHLTEDDIYTLMTGIENSVKNGIECYVELYEKLEKKLLTHPIPTEYKSYRPSCKSESNSHDN